MFLCLLNIRIFTFFIHKLKKAAFTTFSHIPCEIAANCFLYMIASVIKGEPHIPAYATFKASFTVFQNNECLLLMTFASGEISQSTYQGICLRLQWLLSQTYLHSIDSAVTQYVHRFESTAVILKIQLHLCAGVRTWIMYLFISVLFQWCAIHCDCY